MVLSVCVALALGNIKNVYIIIMCGVSSARMTGIN